MVNVLKYCKLCLLYKKLWHTFPKDKEDIFDKYWLCKESQIDNGVRLEYSKFIKMVDNTL